jgi:ribosomal protein S18 acetylase RimI-like enzyme
MATRTYLEMTDRSALRPGKIPAGQIDVTGRQPCETDFWRYLYSTVGEAYNWIDRLSWTDAEIRAYLDDPNITLWVMKVDGELAGYFELRLKADRSIEIVYFGLLPQFTGRGYGGFLLTRAVERAWERGARRVWLHTCSFDHPQAIANYIARGFSIFRTEHYVAQLPSDASGRLDTPGVNS